MKAEKNRFVMKRSFLTLALLSFALSSIGQRGQQNSFFIDFGPKLIFGENALYNSKASFSSDRYFHNPSSLGYGAGFKLALDFTRNIALVGEGVYYRFNQVYDMTEPAAKGSRELNYQKRISYSALEVPIMFRYNNDDMDYFEVGYVHSTILNVSETNDGKGAEVTQKVGDLYTKSNSGLVLGFGGYVWGSNNLGVSTGLRFRYDFQDFVAQNGDVEGAPVYALDSEPKGTTNPLAVNLVIELNYDLGFYMANNGCGNRKLLIGS